MRRFKPMNQSPFQGLDIEVLVEIEERLKAELTDKELPYQRKTEVESCLYYIREAKRVKGGFYRENIEREIRILPGSPGKRSN